MVASLDGDRLCRPVQFAMNRSGIERLEGRIQAVTADRAVGLVRVGVEASGYPLPLLADGVLPESWEAVEFNPAHVAEQRRVNGKRGVKTDVVDATAMFDLLAAGRGSPASGRHDALVELAAWTRYRRSRVAWHQAIEARNPSEGGQGRPAGRSSPPVAAGSRCGGGA